MFISKKKYEADLAAAMERGRAEMQEIMWRNERMDMLQTQINEVRETVGALAEAVGKKHGLPHLRCLGNVREKKAL